MVSADGVGKSERPVNELLRRLSPRDFALISPYLDQFDASADLILYNPGDPVESLAQGCPSGRRAGKPLPIAVDNRNLARGCENA